MSRTTAAAWCRAVAGHPEITPKILPVALALSVVTYWPRNELRLDNDRVAGLVGVTPAYVRDVVELLRLLGFLRFDWALPDGRPQYAATFPAPPATAENEGRAHAVNLAA